MRGMGPTTLLVVILCLTTAHNHVSASCPDNWVGLGSVCYYFIQNTSKNFAGAREYCVNLGGILAEPVTSSEHENIVGHLQNNTCSQNLWIGMIGMNGSFTLASTDQRVNFTQWDSAQPNVADGVNSCVEYNCGTYLWRDNKCGKARHAICEKRDASTTPTPAQSLNSTTGGTTGGTTPAQSMNSTSGGTAGGTTETSTLGNGQMETTTVAQQNGNHQDAGSSTCSPWLGASFILLAPVITQLVMTL